MLKIIILKKQRISLKIWEYLLKITYVFIKLILVNNYKDLTRQNITIKKFIGKVNSKKNYTRSDLRILFSNEQANFICKEYITSF